MKGRGRIKMIIFIIVVFIAAGLVGALLFTEREREEGRNLPITNVDFNHLEDGNFIGEYEGGMYKLRANKVQVTTSQGKVTKIVLLEDKEKRTSEFTEQLYNRVIKSQSLNIDTISGATITSKAYLKSIEDALNKAENK